MKDSKEFNYIISNYFIDRKGQIISKYKKSNIKVYINNRGYCTVRLRVSTNKEKRFTVHRLVALLYVPNPENKPQVNHIDGNKLNNQVSNLEWVTQSENSKHSWSLGLQRYKYGFSGKPQISASWIREDGLRFYGSATGLSKEYNLTRTSLNDVRLGRYKQSQGWRIEL
jgi:hypothetical protein